MEVDLDQIKRTLDCDLGLVEELIEGFLEDFSDQLEELKTVCRGSNTVEMVRVLHDLRGTVVIFCANEIEKSARHLETLAKAGNVDEVREHLDFLCSDLERLAACLSELRQKAA